ncbi:hypothetical protein MNBD_NITROSPINAE01-1100 [hydrothermal vent metagenome]|uniref:RNA polymerase ECF-type sigma factor n=1 Tax=hydrothermal vent metagenome TaxID=652676 RepID=A0A3B1CK12_9ZZZZ
MARFEEITIPHIETLYKMAHHLAGSRDDAEDMVQEVYLKARKSFHTLKEHKKCKSWLCSILYRHFVDEYRKRKPYAEVDINNIPDNNKPEKNDWPEHFKFEDISKSLNKLDPKYRLPLVAHFLSGESYQEIAESLDIPMGTVMSRIHRAKKAMRKDLASATPPSLKIVNGEKHEM